MTLIGSILSSKISIKIVPNHIGLLRELNEVRYIKNSNQCFAHRTYAINKGSVSQLDVILSHSEDMWQSLERFLIATTGRGMLLSPSGWSKRMLLNIVQCTGQPPPQRTA